MIIYNGIVCRTLQELEDAIISLPEDQKILIRNDFNQTVNLQQTSIASVTPRQMRIALIMSGISLSTIDAIIDTLPEPNKSITRVTWEYSVEFQRNNPILVAMVPALGLTTQQIDQLFALAITL